MNAERYHDVLELTVLPILQDREIVLWIFNKMVLLHITQTSIELCWTKNFQTAGSGVVVQCHSLSEIQTYWWTNSGSGVTWGTCCIMNHVLCPLENFKITGINWKMWTWSWNAVLMILFYAVVNFALKLVVVISSSFCDVTQIIFVALGYYIEFTIIVSIVALMSLWLIKINKKSFFSKR